MVSGMQGTEAVQNEISGILNEWTCCKGGKLINSYKVEGWSWREGYVKRESEY